VSRKQKALEHNSDFLSLFKNPGITLFFSWITVTPINVSEVNGWVATDARGKCNTSISVLVFYTRQGLYVQGVFDAALRRNMLQVEQYLSGG
jgi:hypothetical protein